jgi:hypothetical protein
MMLKNNKTFLILFIVYFSEIKKGQTEKSHCKYLLQFLTAELVEKAHLQGINHSFSLISH